MKHFSLFLIFLSLFQPLTGRESATPSQEKKQKRDTLEKKSDFDLFLGTKQRDLVQAATHDTLYISMLYKSGPYLIFDCERGNYACVHKDGFQFCKDLRADSINKRHKVLSCAPLKKFERYRFCIEKQKELVDFSIEKYFCMSSATLDTILVKKKQDN